MAEQARPAQDREENAALQSTERGSTHHWLPVSVAFKTAPAKRNVS